MKKFKNVTLSIAKGLIVSISLLFLLSNGASAFNSGSTGADGAFNPTTNTEVTLPADGKLNYTTVNIPTGVTVTFKKNATNTPVYILATGDVTIAGTISVNGTDGSGIFPGKGGAGGFDGGLGGTPVVESNPALPGGKGLGPGGGNPGSVSTNTDYSSGGGAGGGFGSNGTDGGGYTTYVLPATGGGTYGNAKLLPLICGSGAGGGAGSGVSSYSFTGGAGGGGSGAILIASSGTITVTGSITANGGKGANSGGSYGGGGGGGSGGAIKLMANTITGNGTISAIGGAKGTTTYLSGHGGAGGSGRIRFEANTVTMTSTTTPAYAYSYPSTVFVTNIPTLTITSVGSVNVPASPSGKYGSPDVTLPSTTTNPVTVNVSAANIPTGTQVTVTSVPEYGSSSSTTGALSGTDASSTTSVSLTLSTTYQSILTATATFTVQTAMYYDDEKIEKVRVATTMSKGSEVTYITEKGREIKATELLAKLMK
ncbi:MAG: hypothetical protein AAB322_08405 [Pseudomonadota bacterium]